MNMVNTFIVATLMLFNLNNAYSSEYPGQDTVFKYEVTGNTVTIDLVLAPDHEINTNPGMYYAQLFAVDSNPITKANYLLTDKVYLDTNLITESSEIQKIKVITEFNAPPIDSYDAVLRLYRLEENYIPIGELSYENVNTKVVDAAEEELVNTLSSNGLSLECTPCRIVVNGDFVNLHVTRVSNLRNGGYSGTLRLNVWATNQPYSGGTLRGKIIAQTTLGQLSGNTYIYNIDRTLTLSRPADGIYYIVLTLSEYYNGNFYIMDYNNAKETMTFSATGYSNTAGDGGSGGGGSVDVILMLLIFLAMSVVSIIGQNHKCENG